MNWIEFMEGTSWAAPQYREWMLWKLPGRVADPFIALSLPPTVTQDSFYQYGWALGRKMVISYPLDDVYKV